MGVGDDELDAAQAAPGQATEKLGPERLRLGGTHRHAEHLAPAVAVHPHRDGNGHRDDPARLPDLHVGGVEPKVGPVTLNGASEEVLHPAVDLAAEPRDLALADALHPHGPDQVIHRARRDALHVGLLDHRRQRLLRQPPGLQEGREVGAAPELRDPELHRPGPGLPVPLAVTVPLVHPLRAALAMGGTTGPLRIQLHQPMGGKADHLPQKRRVRALLQQLPKGNPLIGHRGVLWSVLRLATQP